MKKTYNYKDLLKIFSCSFQQLVRCANTLFGGDPEAPRSGGKPRTFDANQVWELYLMVHLVAHLHFRMRAAVELVNRIVNEMESLGLYPLPLPKSLPRVVVRIHPPQVLEIRRYESPEPKIDFKQTQDSDGLLHNTVVVDEGPFTAKFWPEEGLALAAEVSYPAAPTPRPIAEIDLRAALAYVMARL